MLFIASNFLKSPINVPKINKSALLRTLSSLALQTWAELGNGDHTPRLLSSLLRPGKTPSCTFSVILHPLSLLVRGNNRSHATVLPVADHSTNGHKATHSCPLRSPSSVVLVLSLLSDLTWPDTTASFICICYGTKALLFNLLFAQSSFISLLFLSDRTSV